jgi:tetratricopeptide (TPR) repeat protein
MNIDFNRQVERNLLGRELERQNKIKEAILLYKANVQELFEGNFPYDRLSIIYRKLGQKEEEIRVLKTAIYVFENIVNKNRSDRDVKLNKFKNRLLKLNQT